MRELRRERKAMQKDATSCYAQTLTAIKAFVAERQRIYQRKIRGEPWPWTDDIILQRAKINNIFRQFDKFSVYEREFIAHANRVRQAQFILFARYVLSRELVEFVVKKKFTVSIEELTAFKQSVQGGNRYINEAVQFYRPEKGSTERLLVTHLEMIRARTRLFIEQLHHCSTPQAVIQLIRKTYPQLGEFRAYEVYTSLTYCPWFQFTENDFLHIGPGSRKVAAQLGLVSLSDFQNIAKKFDTWLKQLKLNCGQTFTVRTMEDTLCEFRKYTIAKLYSSTVNKSVKIYKPAWYPILAHNMKYDGPRYTCGSRVLFDDSRTQVKVFARVSLPQRLCKLLTLLKHGRQYTKTDLYTIAQRIPLTRSYVAHYLATLAQLGFLVNIDQRKELYVKADNKLEL